MSTLKQNAITATTTNTIAWMNAQNVWESNKLKCLESTSFISDTRWHIVDAFADYYDAGDFDIYDDELTTDELNGILVDVIDKYAAQAA